MRADANEKIAFIKKAKKLLQNVSGKGLWLFENNAQAVPFYWFILTYTINYHQL